MGDDRPVEDPAQAIARLEKLIDDMRTTMMARLGRRPTGDVETTIRSTPKPDTLFLNGQTPLRASYPILWQWAQDQGLVISGLFTVGNGSTTFGLPDLRGRVPIGVGTLGANTYALGDVLGSATVTLTSGEIPSHNHTGTTDSSGTHNHGSNGHSGHFNGTQVNVTDGGGGTVFGCAAWNSGGSTVNHTHSNDGGHTHTFTSGNTGSGGAHENRQPSIALNWLIYV